MRNLFYSSLAYLFDNIMHLELNQLFGKAVFIHFHLCIILNTNYISDSFFHRLFYQDACVLLVPMLPLAYHQLLGTPIVLPPFYMDGAMEKFYYVKSLSEITHEAISTLKRGFQTLTYVRLVPWSPMQHRRVDGRKSCTS